jgi:hypothetical protein
MFYDVVGALVMLTREAKNMARKTNINAVL